MADRITVQTLAKKIEKLEGKNDWYGCLCDVFELSAIVLSNQFDYREPYWSNREKRYKDLIKKYDEDEFKQLQDIFSDLFILLSQMAEPDGVFDDYLGRLYMFSGTSSKRAGQFFTPYNVSKLCAEMTIREKDITNQQIITLNEPTCGSGGMILAGVEALRNKGINYADRLLVVCSDVDKRCVYMTYLQLALSGVPAIILHQNTLTLETFDEWHTPALCLNWMRFRKTIRYINHQLTEEEMKEYDEWNKTYNAGETHQEQTTEMVNVVREFENAYFQIKNKETPVLN